MKKEIIKYPSASLRIKSSPIEIGRDLRILVRNLEDTLIDLDGEGLVDINIAGLAAPQIGTNKRVFITKVSDGVYATYINPVIVKRSVETFPSIERCLSVDGRRGVVKRAEAIVIEFLDMYGRLCRMTHKDHYGCLVQHLVDHLNGVLFIDKGIPNSKKYQGESTVF